MCASPMLSAAGAVPVSPQPPAVDAAEGEAWIVMGLPKARFGVGVVDRWRDGTWCT